MQNMRSVWYVTGWYRNVDDFKVIYITRLNTVNTRQCHPKTGSRPMTSMALAYSNPLRNVSSQAVTQWKSQNVICTFDAINPSVQSNCVTL